MVIVIQGVRFEEVSESFAEKLAHGLLSKSPSVTKAKRIAAEPMTEDLPPHELKVLDILGEQINNGTLKTEPEPMSISGLIRAYARELVVSGVEVISTKEFVTAISSLGEKQLGKQFSYAGWSKRCSNILSDCGGESIQKGIWKLPSIDNLPED